MQTCSESQKVKSSQSNDFDFKFWPENFIFKFKIDRLKIFRIVKLVNLIDSFIQKSIGFGHFQLTFDEKQKSQVK